VKEKTADWGGTYGSPTDSTHEPHAPEGFLLTSRATKRYINGKDARHAAGKKCSGDALIFGTVRPNREGTRSLTVSKKSLYTRGTCSGNNYKIQRRPTAARPDEDWGRRSK